MLKHWVCTSLNNMEQKAAEKHIHNAYPANVNWHAGIKAVCVYDVLAQTARRYPTSPAMDFMGRKWTWREIDKLTAHLAKGLQQKLGVRKGDRVGLFLPNTPYYLISYYALARIGAIVVNLNPLYAERELEKLIEDTDCRIIVTADLKLTFDKAYKMLHSTALEKLVICSFASALPFVKKFLFAIAKRADIAKPGRDKRFITFNDLLINDGKPYPVDLDPYNDVAVLQFTGGTTGEPKGAMLTHANITANTEQSHLWFPDAIEGGERMLSVLPFFHAFAMTAIMNMSVRKGLEIITLPRFNLKQTLEIIHKKRPEYFVAVPAIYNAIANAPGRKKYDLSSLRFCVSGGESMPAEVKKSFEQIAGCKIVEGYGLSEASPVVCVNPVETGGKIGSIGLPLPGTTVEIVDTANGSILPPGRRGELCVKGPQVMKGYWQKDKDTQEVFEGGYLHTGDIAVKDEDGYVYIVDRIKDLIITNGYNVYPRNVEEAIYLHPSVEECVAAGVPDRLRGEVVKAWIKCKEGRQLNEETIKAFLKDKLSPMQIPRIVEIRNQPLPRTMIGKLSRKDLLEKEKLRK